MLNAIITRYIKAPILAEVQKALTFVSGSQTMVLDLTNGLDLSGCGFTLWQSWQNMLASRVVGTTYTNNDTVPTFTECPIVSVQVFR